MALDVFHTLLEVPYVHMVQVYLSQETWCFNFNAAVKCRQV